MIKEDNRKALLRALQMAKEDLLQEQNKVLQDIASLPLLAPQLLQTADIESAASNFLAAAGSSPPDCAEWMPEKLHRIADIELRGALGLHYLVVAQLNYMRASHAFLKVIAQCN